MLVAGLVGLGATALVGGLALGVAALSADEGGDFGVGKGRATEKFKGITGTERQYQRKGGGDVQYTKNGQPYVYDKKGRPKFIKRSKVK